ncbi:MAG: conserved rane protein of unknown function [Hyphomicrobiales bacterium]|nr:conserved rane protein of unknown function [Hyphomicrobiales bacterium]
MSQVELVNVPLLSPAPHVLDNTCVKASGWSSQVTTVAVGALALFAVVAFSAWTFSGTIVPWDSKNQFYPFFRFMADGLSRGDLPLWNPYHFGGHPSVADPQSLLFTPTMAVFALLAPKASMTAFDAAIFAHLFAGGLGMVLLFRRRNWRPAGGVLAGAIFMLGGVAASRLQHTGMIISYAFFPLALLVLEEMLERGSWRFAALFGAMSALMLLGRDQTAFLLAFVLAGAFARQMLQAQRPLDYLWRAAPHLLFASAIVAAVLAIPSLLTMQFLAISNRPEMAYDIAVTGSLHPANIATLFAGDVFGSTNWNYVYWGPGYGTSPLPDHTDRSINYLFAGSLPLLLIVWHGLAGGRLLERSGRAFALLGLVATLYAMGRYTPVFAILFDHLPGVSLYRRPADAAFLLNIAIAGGAGYLLHRYIVDGPPRPIQRLGAPLAGALALATLSMVWLTASAARGFLHSDFQITSSTLAVGRAAAVTLAFAVVLVVAHHWRERGREWAAIFMVVATGGQLIACNAASSLNAEAASHYALYDGAAPPDSRGLEALAQIIREENAKGSFPRVEILGLGGPWQNAAMVLGLENTLGYNPLRIADYARAVGPGENSGDPNLRSFPRTFTSYLCNLAGLLGLEYVVLDRPLERLPVNVPRPKATQIYAGKNMYVYRLGAPAPRAILATGLKVIDHEALLEKGVLPDVDRRNEALLDAESMSALTRAYPEKAPADEPVAHVAIQSRDNTSVTLNVDSVTGGVVVLHDVYYPGWEARVDGVAKPLLRADLLFRGVEVGPGRHEVTFAFRPFSGANLMAAAKHLLK